MADRGDIWRHLARWRSFRCCIAHSNRRSTESSHGFWSNLISRCDREVSSKAYAICPRSFARFLQSPLHPEPLLSRATSWSLNTGLWRILCNSKCKIRFLSPYHSYLPQCRKKSISFWLSYGEPGCNRCVEASDFRSHYRLCRTLLRNHSALVTAESDSTPWFVWRRCGT